MKDNLIENQKCRNIYTPSNCDQFIKNDSPKKSQKYTLLKEEFKFYNQDLTFNWKEIFLTIILIGMIFTFIALIQYYLIDKFNKTSQVSLFNFCRGLCFIFFSILSLYLNQVDLEDEKNFNKIDLNSIVILAIIENLGLFGILLALKFLNIFYYSLCISGFVFVYIVYEKYTRSIALNSYDYVIIISSLSFLFLILSIGEVEKFKGFLVFSVASVLLLIIKFYKTIKIPQQNDQIRILANGLIAIVSGPILISIEKPKSLDLFTLFLCIIFSILLLVIYKFSIKRESNFIKFEEFNTHYCCFSLLIVISFVFFSYHFIDFLISLVFLVLFYYRFKYY